MRELNEQLKNQRTSGPSEISAELIKNEINKLFSLITQSFKKCLNGDVTPEKWRIKYLTSTYKKGNGQIWENYLGINVTAIFSGLYEKILKDYIEEEIRIKKKEKQSKFESRKIMYG